MLHRTRMHEEISSPDYEGEAKNDLDDDYREARVGVLAGEMKW